MMPCSFCIQKWLWHTGPNEDKNQSRWPLSALWQVMQHPSSMGNALPAVREKKVELDAEREKADFVGFATSWAM